MSQCPPNFSYVEVGKAVDLDSLEKMGENVGYGSQGILEDLDFGTGGLDLKNLCFGSFSLGYLANGVGLPRSSN